MSDDDKPAARISIRDLMKLTVAVAIGLYAAGGQLRAMGSRFLSIGRPDTILLSSRVFLAAFVAVMGFDLVIETIRDPKGPRPLGLGRQTIAITLVFWLVVMIEDFYHLANTTFNHSIFANWAEVGLLLARSSEWLPHFVVGSWIVAIVLGQRIAMRADLIEWAGRGIAACLVALAVAKHFL